MAFDDADDGFDWDAAVAEIDKACIRARAGSSGNVAGGAEIVSTQSKALHQRTLDSFVRGGARQTGTPTEVQPPRPPVRNGPFVATSTRKKPSSARPGKQKSAAPDLRNHSGPSTARGEDGSGLSSHLPLDLDAAKIWIYPENVPRRSYQYDITQSALFCNTLVCLPTGLGKTLIAAVVMYNYYRWFPTGKIVFTAPSRPLVVQQIEACHNVTGISQDYTIDMTGQMNPTNREENWKSKRVFFVTPQVLEKDIQSGRCATKDIVCLVVDEAHRATGNYSSCVVVRELIAAKVEPRILALTATPGSKQITIQAVVDNLQISCLEYRNENDPDVSQYTHNRECELIEVAMNAESVKVKDVFMEVLEPIVQRLCYLRVFYSRDIVRLTPFEFLTARDKFRDAPPPTLQQSRYHEVENYFGLAITLFHIFKLLFTHGMRPALEMLQDKLETGTLKRLAKNQKLRQVLDLMKQSVGHGAPSPKLDKVVDIINRHFGVHDAGNTRVIIFTNFRESVKDIMERLAAACASVRAMEFIGQSSGKASKGQTQKIQQAVLQNFRGGCYNTIVATSIAEEGLDIMEVDLVICFDANVSPLRMIQRMGRTGRKRDGRVVVLASSGAELQGYLKKQSKSKVLGKHMLNGGVQSFKFHPSCRMIPHSLRTRAEFMELSVQDFVPRGRKQKEKKSGVVQAKCRTLSEKQLGILTWAKAMEPCSFEFSAEEERERRKKALVPKLLHTVKHGTRYSMYLDVLRPLFPEDEELSDEQKVTASVGEVLAGSTNKSSLVETCPEALTHIKPNPKKDHEGPRSDNQEQRGTINKAAITPSISGKDQFQGACLDKEIECDNRHRVRFMNGRTTYVAVDVPKVTDKVSVNACPMEEKNCDFHQLVGSAVAPKASGGHLSSGCMILGADKVKVNADYENHHQSTALSDVPHQDVDHHMSLIFNSGRYSSVIVSLAQSGGVAIASFTPERVSNQNIEKDVIEPLYPCNSTCVNIESHRARSTASDGDTWQTQRVQTDLVLDIYEEHSCVSMSPIGPGVRTKPLFSNEKVAQTVHVDLEQLSPRLADFAKFGQVPRTPVKGTQFFQPHHGTKDLHTSLDRLVKIPTETPPLQPSSKIQRFLESPGFVLPSSSPSVKECQDKGVPSRSKLSLKRTCLPMVSRCPVAVPPPPLSKELPIKGSVQKIGSSSFHACTISRDSGDPHNNPTKSSLPSSRCQSDTEDWQVSVGEATSQRPRKLKRLRKACDKLSTTTSKRGLQRSNLAVVRGQRERELAARVFIDEEAEASSDDHSSESDDSEGDAGDATQAFIDYETTQHLNGSVNMMAVYRKSLLTPSPQGGYVAAKMVNRYPQHLTPSSDVASHSSILSSPLTASLDCNTPQSNPSPLTNKSVAPADNPPNVHGAIPLNPECVSGVPDVVKDGRNSESRKRKLSFHVSHSYEEDFLGVDLDALEAEATKLIQARKNLQGNSSKVVANQNEHSSASRLPTSKVFGPKLHRAVSSSQFSEDDGFQ